MKTIWRQLTFGEVGENVSIEGEELFLESVVLKAQAAIDPRHIPLGNLQFLANPSCGKENAFLCWSYLRKVLAWIEEIIQQRQEIVGTRHPNFRLK